MKFYHAGLVLKKIRERRKLSQAELGKMIDIHVQAVSNFERGMAMPPKHSFKKLASALRMTAKDKHELLAAINQDHINNNSVAYKGLV